MAKVTGRMKQFLDSLDIPESKDVEKFLARLEDIAPGVSMGDIFMTMVGEEWEGKRIAVLGMALLSRRGIPVPMHSSLIELVQDCLYVGAFMAAHRQKPKLN